MSRLNLLAKSLIALGIIVVMFVAVGVYFTAGRTTTNKTSTPITTENQTEAGLVDNVRFASAGGLEKISEVQPDPTSLILPVGDRVAYQDVEYTTYVGQTRLDGVPAVSVREWFYTSQGEFLVDSEIVPFVVENTSQPRFFSDDVVSVTEFQGKYRYLRETADQGRFEIKESPNLFLDTNQPVLADFQTNLDFSTVKIHTIADNTYVLLQDRTTADYELWQLLNGRVRKLREFKETRDLKVFDDFLIFTEQLEIPNDLTDLKINLLDLRRPQQPTVQNLNWTAALGKSGIYGQPLPQRCDYDEVNKLYCLAKEKDVSSLQEEYRDVLFTYDLETQRIEYPYQSFNFSASRLYVEDEEIYLNLQDGSGLYKFSD